MSKRMPLTISGLLTLTVIAYLGYEACIYHTTDSTLEDFLEVYLNNPQKYIFNGMIYGIPAIYSNVLLFRRTEILIRVKSTLLQRITLKSVKTSVLLGIYIFLIYILTAFFSGMDIRFYPGMALIIYRLFIFYLQCHALFYLIYAVCGNPVWSVSLVAVINMTALVVMQEISFLNNLSSSVSLRIFTVYECISFILVYTGAAVVIKNKPLSLRDRA